MNKLNKLIETVEGDILLKYLVPDLLKIRDGLMKEFLQLFPSLSREMVVISVMNYYNLWADRLCDEHKNTKTCVFPYIDKATGATFIRGLYDRIRKIQIVIGYTEAYLNESDPKKQTEDHYLIVEFAASKFLIEMLILGERGRYDNESLLLHIIRLCNVIKCTTYENNNILKKNKDEEGLRHLEGYLNHGIKIYDKDKRKKSCDSEPMIINFEDLPTNKGLFITDKLYPELKYYTNRMFVADYSELKKLGPPNE